jgi:hypothetical protein
MKTLYFGKRLAWVRPGQFPRAQKIKKGVQKSTPHFWGHLVSVAHFLVFSSILDLVDGVGDVHGLIFGLLNDA